MPTLISHAVAALGLSALFYRREVPKGVWALGAVCAALPDADVLAFAVGIPYEQMLGHRGLSHSPAFAAAVAAALVACFRRGVRGLSPGALGAYFFAVTASHGLLDALTDGGLGVAFLAPFSGERFFFPWQPIEVSPIGLRRFLSGRGLEVLRSELLWVWLPSILLAGAALGWRGRSVAQNALPNPK
ncbi:MAG TPA: metal-dependent hydrolase [Thermoanaerobaculia bacterium]|nr:metal-dependent hydrolase [Thermoanaerobaculia bacterium]